MDSLERYIISESVTAPRRTGRKVSRDVTSAHTSRSIFRPGHFLCTYRVSFQISLVIFGVCRARSRHCISRYAIFSMFSARSRCVNTRAKNCYADSRETLRALIIAPPTDTTLNMFEPNQGFRLIVTHECHTRVETITVANPGQSEQYLTNAFEHLKEIGSRARRIEHRTRGSHEKSMIFIVATAMAKIPPESVTADNALRRREESLRRNIPAGISAAEKVSARDAVNVRFRRI